MALSFAKDIRDLFRDEDIVEMKDFGGFDLSKYEDVRQHANRIYQRTKAGDMPCDSPWSDAMVEKFKQWMDEGMQA